MWDPQFEQILRDYLPFLSADEPLTEDINLREHGLDSLAMVELLANLENAFAVRFVDEALKLETFQSPGVLWSTLSGLTAANA
ncbi:hypothetical protein GCM10010174_35950 [Kutzneria viridogrisea]|uniref:Carrier domain-containing protein n=2 Tax=Kutzneria TaxID=43356 RepID=W5W2X0_9PSEU|nr:phosphopantetheine-binding protein [Kutzneria albida]AHH94851.1 hypothetical protein KALB_1478 [Kutzneria albida DSM 43870]MBA8927805.1 acyl carrier protein [Kutzneria viridogrisea]